MPRHPNSKLTPDKVREIRRLRKEGVSYGKLSKMFEVSIGSIESVVFIRTWKWVGDERPPTQTPPKSSSEPSGKKYGKYLVTPERLAIGKSCLEMSVKGAMNRQIAIEHGISRPQVYAYISMYQRERAKQTLIDSGVL